jgi:iron-sulfur cluster repair protein YtfE (RIC family)
MSPETNRQISALIDRILTQFHEGHRRALPELLAMAATVEAQAASTAASLKNCAPSATRWNSTCSRRRCGCFR